MEIQLSYIISELVDVLEPYFIPEVGINIGYAKLHATTPSDVYALSGRIIRVGNQARCYGTVESGASKHIARIILTAMSKNEKFRSAMNIKYRPEIVEQCKKLGLTIGSFDRLNEPGDTSSMEWGTKTVIEELGYVPDVIFDKGGVGKEPMIRILGNDPEDVLNIIKRIIKGRSKHYPNDKNY
jgi:hydroxymethylpyrimidine/phosphomethylpyrimidine kinase